jgi:uncharacterized protein
VAEPAPIEGRHPEIVDAAERRQYEALIGGQRAGFLTYARRPGRILLIHTEVDPAFEGRGVGGALARHALDAAAAEGRRAIVHCPFITTWLRRHREYHDIAEIRTGETRPA